MIVKRFSATKTLNTNVGVGAGFTRGRNYDQDLNRLGRMSTAQRELHSELRSLGSESRNLTIEGELRKEKNKLWRRDTN